MTVGSHILRDSSGSKDPCLESMVSAQSYKAHSHKARRPSQLTLSLETYTYTEKHCSLSLLSPPPGEPQALASWQWGSWAKV